MFSLESPHRGDSNENIQYTIFIINTKKHPKLFKICIYEIFTKGLKNQFETAVVNESPVFEPLKFYCITFRTNVSFKQLSPVVFFSFFFLT